MGNTIEYLAGKKWALIPLSVGMAFALTACSTASGSGESTSTKSNQAAISFTDMSGKTINLEHPAERLVVMTASDCEIVYALGQEGSLVGRGEFCDYPQQVADVEVVSSGDNLNAEQIIALQPDVLIMSTMGQNPEQVQTLEEAGITVVTSDAQDIEGVYTAIEMIGTVTGADEEATKLCDEMKGEFETLKEQSAGKEGGTVYFEVSPLKSGLWAAGNKTFMNEAAEMLGLTNVFADVDGWAEVSEEQVIQRNPDYIVTITMTPDGEMKAEDEIMSREGWDTINAVKNKKILNLPNNELSRPGPRLVDGTKALYNFVYGDK